MCVQRILIPELYQEQNDSIPVSVGFSVDLRKFANQHRQQITRLHDSATIFCYSDSAVERELTTELRNILPENEIRKMMLGTRGFHWQTDLLINDITIVNADSLKK